MRYYSRTVTKWLTAMVALTAAPCVLAAQKITPGTYAIVGAGTDTTSTRVATHFAFPLQFSGIGQIDTGWVVIGGTDGRAVSLYFRVHAAESPRRWNGLLQGGATSDLYQFTDSAKTETYGYFHAKPNGDRFFLPGNDVRMKLAKQP